MRVNGEYDLKTEAFGISRTHFSTYEYSKPPNTILTTRNHQLHFITWATAEYLDLKKILSFSLSRLFMFYSISPAAMIVIVLRISS